MLITLFIVYVCPLLHCERFCDWRFALAATNPFPLSSLTTISWLGEKLRRRNNHQLLPNKYCCADFWQIWGWSPLWSVASSGQRQWQGRGLFYSLQNGADLLAVTLQRATHNQSFEASGPADGHLENKAVEAVEKQISFQIRRDFGFWLGQFEKYERTHDPPPAVRHGRS